MVTLIHVRRSRAAASATSPIVSSAAAEDSIINNVTSTAEINTELQTQLGNEPSSNDQVQYTSPSFENNNISNDGRETTKRDLQAVDSNSSKQMRKKRQKFEPFIIDLSGVPQQSPILKCAGRIKEESSKYAGVSCDKRTNKWKAQLHIEGILRYIGHYENEEEAASDYARALLKYRGQEALDKARKRKPSAGPRLVIDLGGVPQQPPILKSAGRIKEGTSKYTGVSYHERMNKWQAQIRIDGQQRHIGSYENEEEAASDYARALLKYKARGTSHHAQHTHSQINVCNTNAEGISINSEKSPTMLIRQRKQPSEMTASKSGEEDDISALIYRESQLRKREAAAVAASLQINWEDDCFDFDDGCGDDNNGTNR